MKFLLSQFGAPIFCIVLFGLFVLSTLSITQVIFQLNQSSDSYYLLALYEDLFVHGYDITQWNFTPAPYFFPDAAILFPLLRLFSDYGYGMAMYILLFWGCLIVCTAEIGNNFQCGEAISYTLSTACVLLGMAVIRMYDGFGLPGFLFLPSFHAGCLFYGMINLVWMHHWLTRRPTKSEATVNILLGAVMIFSDPLYFAQFALPIVTAALVLFVCRMAGGWNCLYIFLCNVISIGLAQLMYTINQTFGFLNIPRTYYLFQNELDSIWETVLLVITEQRHLAQHTSLYLFLLILILTLTFVGLIVNTVYRKQLANHAFKTFVYVFTFFLSSILMMLTVLGVTGIWDSIWQCRYFLNFYVLPFSFLAWLLLSLPFQWMQWVRYGFITLALFFTCFTLSDEILDLRMKGLRLPYPEWLQELDALCAKTGMTYGYGEYWNAKFVTIGSRANVRVNQVHENIVQNEWINNNAWALKPNGEYPNYQFFLPEHLPRDKYIQLFGTPANEVQLGAKDVLLYNRKSDYAFRNFLKGQIRFESFQPRIHHPIEPKTLSGYKRFGHSWDQGSVVFSLDHAVDVRFDPPAIGEVLEISADGNDIYQAEIFLQDEEDEAAEGLTIPRKASDGLIPRYLKLPKEAQNQPIRLIRIRPIEGDNRFGIGHVFVYEDG